MHIPEPKHIVSHNC